MPNHCVWILTVYFFTFLCYFQEKHPSGKYTNHPSQIQDAMASHDPEKLFHRMQQPDFYPHSPENIEVRETLISKVFLAGDRVYKIKKPVDLGFLDFSTLEKREYFCHQEVKLNRRLADNIYLDVVSICLNKGVYQLGGPGTTVEYAVKMDRLPDHASMDRLLEQGRVQEKEISSLAAVLADFYARPENKVGPDTDVRTEGGGTWETVKNNCIENFDQTAQSAGSLFDARLFNIVRAATLAFLQRRKTLFEKRFQSGQIRDCHGDLRTEHVYFIDGKVRIIDCIEFNERFRYEDPVSDLAFLAMDLDARGHEQTAHLLLTEYAERSRDVDLYVLIDFYKCYRAMVRFKVGCIRVKESDLSETEKDRLQSGIEHYLNLAYGYAVEFTRPVIWIVCGMPASGKSTIAKQLGRILDIPVFESDVIRKQHFAAMFEDFSHLGFEQGIYSRGVTALTYGRLLLLAQETLGKGGSVVLDATFSAKHFRREALRLAEEMDANIFFVECAAPESVLKERLIRREDEGGISDARIRHFEAMRNGFEPIEEIPPEQHIVLTTQQPLDECMNRIFYHEYIGSQCSERLRR
jgi:uncharacterized protein